MCDGTYILMLRLIRMQHLTDSIKKSITNKNWYSAIATALTIPDICSKISDGTKTTGKKYAQWFDDYVGKNYRTNYSEGQLAMVRKHSTEEDYQNLLKGTKLSGNDCYALRCAFLHEGTGTISTQKAREILDEIKFLEPSFGLNLHGSIQNNKLILHIDEFSYHIIDGVDKWLIQLNTEQTERLKSFLKVNDVFDFVKETK